MKRVIVVVATTTEADFFACECWADVHISGIGPVSAALCTAAALSRRRYALAISAGIGGGFAQNGVQIGDVVVSERMTLADLGAWNEDDFLSVEELNLAALPHATGPARFASFAANSLGTELRAVISAHGGEILTVSSATGSEQRAKALLKRFPNATCEGMEGAGVAQTAFQFGVPALEIRGISNTVGKRDRNAWRIPEALNSCQQALASLAEILR